MGEERTRHSLRRRRGFGRAAAVFACLGAALVALGGCGGGGTAVASEKAADAEVVNGALERELTAIEAYARGLGSLRGSALVLARRFQEQDQEHVDALTAVMHGLGSPVEAEAAELEAGRGEAAALDLAYEQENAALAYDVVAAKRLQTPPPRALVASIAASHAQHLVLLRQALGVPPGAAAPEAFEPGNAPPPAKPGKGG